MPLASAAAVSSTSLILLAIRFHYNEAIPHEPIDAGRRRSKDLHSPHALGTKRSQGGRILQSRVRSPLGNRQGLTRGLLNATVLLGPEELTTQNSCLAYKGCFVLRWRCSAMRQSTSHSLGRSASKRIKDNFR